MASRPRGADSVPVPNFKPDRAPVEEHGPACHWLVTAVAASRTLSHLRGASLALQEAGDAPCHGLRQLAAAIRQ
jgi:hypothetical protein